MEYLQVATLLNEMEKKLNECVGGGGLAQDIIDIKGSLNSINDNLSNILTKLNKN